MPKIKVSFIGLGRVFNHYLFIIKKFNLKKYIEIDCLCDQDEKLIKKFKKKIKGKFYTSIKIFLDNCTSDVVFILTPSDCIMNTVCKLSKKILMLLQKNQ